MCVIVGTEQIILCGFLFPFSCDSGQTETSLTALRRETFICDENSTQQQLSKKLRNNAVPPTTELIELADMKGV